MYESHPLQRMLGARTALLVGMGVAIGSGIFRTPGEVAVHLPSPVWIVIAWIAGGVVALMQGMVTAELATRFPKAGGEYVYLREAYGDFFAFFFGWAYTLFVVGGGAATIARALGDFAAELLRVDATWSGWIAAAAVVATTAINAIGLRAGAGAQNVLTSLRIVALLGVVAVGFALAGSGGEGARSDPVPAGAPTVSAFLGGFLSVLWSYSGTTDTAKLAEEIKDVRRAMPRAVIGSAAALTVLYVLFNVSLMRIVPLDEMAGMAFVPGEALKRVFGDSGQAVMLVVAILVCLGALTSTVLATVRVTFALARDGLAFRILSYMSRSQSPVPALILVASFAVILVLSRDFGRILGIYFFASAILFGLAYGSLIIFRVRDPAFPDHVFRCPFGTWQAAFLILFQLALAVNIAWGQPRDALYTTLLLVLFGALYGVQRRVATERKRT